MSSAFEFQHIETPANKWTFQPKPVRRFVESHLEGRVLNLFAGQTELRHSGEIVRNDIDGDLNAEHRFDAANVSEYFDEETFDTVILDPPYNVRKSREKYGDGDKIKGKFTHVKDQIRYIVKPGGKVLHFGYASTGMGRNRGFRKEGIALFNHKGDINDTIAVVETRVEQSLESFH